MWFRRKVKSGVKVGRQLGYPTLNFKVGSFEDHYKPAVYACILLIAGKQYKGALYLGPKFLSKSNVLEVFVVDFSRQIYGQFVSFKVGKKVRGPMKFSSLEELRKQILKDLKSVV